MSAIEQKPLGGSGGVAYASRALLELYPRGLKLFVLAPLALALVILPEFLQHIVEIRLGMFDSRAAFKAHQLDAARMAFGYAKIAGLLLAFLASARFWWMYDGSGRWTDLRQVAWGRLAAGAAIFFGIGALPELVKARLVPATYQLVAIGWSLIFLPFLFLLLAGLFNDRSTRISEMVKRSWPWLLLTALLAVFAFAPSSWLHQMNHHWALGAPPAVVWGLMIFDSLLVGLMAGLTGTAFYLGYAGFAQSAEQRAAKDPISVEGESRACDG